MAGPNGPSRIAETSRVGPSFDVRIAAHGRPSRRVGGLPPGAPPLRPAAPPRLVRPPLSGQFVCLPACSRPPPKTTSPDAWRSATVAPVIGAAAPVPGSTKCRPRVAEYTECMARCRASAQSQPPRGAGGPQLPPPAALRPALRHGSSARSLAGHRRSAGRRPPRSRSSVRRQNHLSEPARCRRGNLMHSGGGRSCGGWLRTVAGVAGTGRRAWGPPRLARRRGSGAGGDAGAALSGRARAAAVGFESWRLQVGGSWVAASGLARRGRGRRGRGLAVAAYATARRKEGVAGAAPFGRAGAARGGRGAGGRHTGER